MSILLGRGYYQNNDNVYESYDFNVSIEENGYLEFMTESIEENANLTRALYTADIMLESRALEGEDVSQLVTEAMSSFFQKSKEYIKKLWAKIKQWFDKVKRFFQIMFTTGKDFIKKFGSDIRSAASNCSGFKYQFYDVKKNKIEECMIYISVMVEDAEKKLENGTSKIKIKKVSATNSSNANEKKFKTTRGEEISYDKDTQDTWERDDDYKKNFGNSSQRNINAYEKQSGTYASSTKTVDTGYGDIIYSKDQPSKIAKDEVLDTVKNMLNAVITTNFENTSEFKKELREALLGDSREEFEDFSKGPSYTEMMDWVSEYQKTKEGLEKNERTIKRALAKCESEINDQEKEHNDTNATKVLEYIRSMATETCNYLTTGIDVVKGVKKTLYKDSQSVLKSLLRHKPKTESFYYNRRNDHENILEMALRSL